MLDTSTPDLPDSLRVLSQHCQKRRKSIAGTAGRPPRNRRIRARRTAAIMVAFGIVLGCVEMIILLSYL